MSKCNKIRQAWARGDRIGALRIARGFLMDPPLPRFSSAAWMHTTIQAFIVSFVKIQIKSQPPHFGCWPGSSS
jgi:hypothetical protein